jgi:hypothetical protein
VAYASLRNRKPMEMASKISHGEIINNPAVKSYLSRCSIPTPAAQNILDPLLVAQPIAAKRLIKVIIAIDGGFRETFVRDEFPSASITFFTFGPLLFRLSDLEYLDRQRFIAPEDLARLKKIQRYSLVLPTRNVSLKALSLRRSVRQTLQDFLLQKTPGDPSLMEALRWILFREWESPAKKTWQIPNCPNEGCDERSIELTSASPDEGPCPKCGKPVYIVDALRLHERVDQEQGAGAIVSYVMTTIEQIALAHIIMSVWHMKPGLIGEILFVKDGPLAFFGQTAPLSAPFRELAKFLSNQPDPEAKNGSGRALLNVVGLEKSGAFVDHAIQIESQIPAGKVLPLSNEYIYKYIIPGDPSSPDPYGGNTYWGAKLIFKAMDGNVYVATVPTGDFQASPKVTDYLNLPDILAVLGSLRCSMYDNALVPIALANKLVSLSDFPSSRILETFAKANVTG